MQRAEVFVLRAGAILTFTIKGVSLGADIDQSGLLIYMTTAQGLAGIGLLVRVEVALDPDEQPQRLVYVLPAVRDWMATILPNLASDGFVSGAATPFEQADALLYDFIIGKAAFEMAPRCMRPRAHGVWELRTYDLRLFGFFWRRAFSSPRRWTRKPGAKRRAPTMSTAAMPCERETNWTLIHRNS